ncbi:phosphoglycerate dehydrogenase [Methanosarcinales archaeon]|nr:MAG: phosphoglycerate dehydrogenase [Methanosarcinales archaeon]
MKVLVSDPLAREGIEELLNHGFEVDVITGLSESELCNIIGEYDALIVRSGTKVTKKVIEHATNLKIVGRAGVGVDNIDVRAATERGIIVANAPEGNTVSAAEHTIAMMMALARNIPQAHASLKRGEWNRSKFIGTELRGKTVGIIGLGRIGAEVARRCSCLETEVIAYDPYVSEERARSLGATLVSLDELIARADIITVHTPLTKDTKDLIDTDEFDRMKKGVRIINCARGGIVNEEALYNAIKEGKIAGAALDVFVSEPPTGSPLLELENVVVTPHLGASTEEAQINVAITIARQVIDALEGKPVRNAINMPYIKPEVLSEVRPYIELAEKLGKFTAQLISGYDTLEVVLAGDIPNKADDVLTIASIKGVLEPVVGSGVNYVNAEYLAKERRLKVIKSTKEEGDIFSDEITIRLFSSSEQRYVTGSIVGGVPKITRIDSYSMDVVPRGYMVVVWHIDKPNIIGPCCVVLGEEGINIAGMQVGRIERGGESIMVLSTDSEVPDDLLRKIEGIDGVLSAKLVII